MPRLEESTAPHAVPRERWPRLDQALSRFGYATRRGARAFLQRGHVTLDGEPLSDPAQRVDPSLLLIRGQPVEAPNGIFVMLHKPSGHVCSKDEGEGPTVYDLLPGSWQNRNPSPSSVGRLDKDTTGLLLITDDGLLQHRLTAPSGHTVKIYEAELENEPGPEVEEAFASGLQLRGETKPCLPARLERLGGNRARIHLTEGRYHQVRRMFAACGHHVTALHRVAFGPWHLGDLPCGSWRFCESNPGPNPVSSPTPPSPAP